MTFGTGNSVMRHQLLNCSRNSLLSFSQSQPQQHTATHKPKQFRNPTIHLHMIILTLLCHLYVTIAHSNQQLNTLQTTFPLTHCHILYHVAVKTTQASYTAISCACCITHPSQIHSTHHIHANTFFSV